MSGTSWRETKLRFCCHPGWCRRVGEGAWAACDQGGEAWDLPVPLGGAPVVMGTEASRLRWRKTKLGFGNSGRCGRGGGGEWVARDGSGSVVDSPSALSGARVVIGISTKSRRCEKTELGSLLTLGGVGVVAGADG